MSTFKSPAIASHALLLVLSMFTRASAAATTGNCTCSPNPTTTFVLYTQSVWDVGTNTNYTSYAVAGIQGTDFSSAQFGTINVFDNPLTVAASPTSALIGRFRSIYVVAALSGDTLYISGTLQFTAGQYANSTLNVKGLGPALMNMPMQLGIDGGTNAFRDAIGNVTLLIISRVGTDTVGRVTINVENAI